MTAAICKEVILAQMMMCSFALSFAIYSILMLWDFPKGEEEGNAGEATCCDTDVMCPENVALMKFVVRFTLGCWVLAELFWSLNFFKIL